MNTTLNQNVTSNSVDTQASIENVDKLFNLYLQRELNYCLRRFDFETSLRWREQLFENKDKICDSIKRDLLRGSYHGFYHYK